jgi:uncharacterized protein YkwD
MIFIICALAILLPFLHLQAYAAPIPTSFARQDSSLTDITDYLYAHNSIRVLHSAALLTWDEDLAAGAQSWASACNFKHSDGVLSDAPYGENIAAATGDFGIVAAVQSFIADEDSYDPSSPTFSDFTQVVWKDSTSLGCAYNTQCSGIFSGSEPATLHVCLYNPPGNVVGQASENVQV